jgi:hypothetical protein
LAIGFVLINVSPGREREVFDILVKENNGNVVKSSYVVK